MYKFIPNGSLTRIIFPYTKNYKINITNNISEPLTLNFSENDKIGFFVYQNILKNKKMYSILEINENVSKNRYEPFEDYIRTTLFITLDKQNNYIEEKILFKNDYLKSNKFSLIYNLKIDTKLESRFHYSNVDMNQTININDRLSLSTIQMFKNIENDIKSSNIF
jgi:hypothetical protein